MRKKKRVTYSVMFFGLLLVFFLISGNSLLSAQTQEETQTQKRKGSINVALGTAKSNDKETGNFGLLKSIDWNVLSGWASGGINFGIIKNEILLLGNISLKIPFKRIEPFVTAGYGIILERFSPASNYGGGIRVQLGKKIGIVAEYRKLHFKYKESQRNSTTSVDVDFFGAGLLYFF